MMVVVPGGAVDVNVGEVVVDVEVTVDVEVLVDVEVAVDVEVVVEVVDVVVEVADVNVNVNVAELVDEGVMTGGREVITGTSAPTTIGFAIPLDSPKISMLPGSFEGTLSTAGFGLA